ncbi:unnamed protein product [Brassica oleracea var. botrytis]
MGGCISVAFSSDAVFCYSVYHRYKCYIYNLEENIISLAEVVKSVEARRDDLLARILIEESRGYKRLSSVQGWLARVAMVTRQAYDLLDDAQVERNMNMLCFCGYCSKSCESSYRYGKKVYFLLREIESLGSNGNFEVLGERPIYTRAPPALVGREIMLNNTRKLLMEDRVGIMGLYGMGGVGKTELFLTLYNEISAGVDSPFDILLWIVVSPEINGVQDSIAKILSLYNEEWGRKSVSQKAMNVHSILGRNRFLMVLDDLWEKLEFADIGVPLPTRENGSKIVIISRSRSVCEAMGADDYIEVRPLEMDTAWYLFRNIVGETNVRRNPEIARKISDRCNGLPLALKVVGASLASTRTWEDTLDILNFDLLDDPIRKDMLLDVLKCSYDALESKTIKMCFLLCALFPEDQEIRKDELVELWIGEQIIGEDSYEESNSLGHEIIRILLDKNLLVEAGESRDRIQMNELTREMALYKASHPELDDDNIIAARYYTQVGELSNIKDLRDVNRVFLRGNHTKTISGHLDCPKLKTLFVRDAMLEDISPELFTCLPLLVVLDLSLNKHLNKLPDAISELVLLRYLNLSSTGIKQLPPGLSQLTKLIFLNLEHTHMLQDISGIKDLVSMIQVLRLCDSGFRASYSLLEELRLLKHLELLTITLQDEDVVQQFLTTPKLVSCTQRFYLEYCAVSSSINITSLSRGLRCLDIQYSYIPGMEIDPIATESEAIITVSAIPIDRFFTNLIEVRLDGCNGLRDLTWLLFASRLTSLRVVQSKDIEEIISKDKAPNLDIDPFEGLGFLALEGLIKLRSIYWKPLPLPRLREIRVRSCPGLRNLPVNSESATETNLVISAEKEFMRRLVWEDEATKQRFFPSSSEKASGQTSREA